MANWGLRDDFRIVAESLCSIMGGEEEARRDRQEIKRTGGRNWKRTDEI